nr:hypothetical protein [Tanacetum cinerariifolium]
MMEAGTLTDEALRNGTIKKNLEKKGNVGEPSKDRNGREDNERTRTKNAFATTANPVKGGYTVVAVNGGQGRGNQGNQARGRSFMLGTKEARRDPNIMMGTFTLNDHYATTLFDSGADYSFVSTTLIPLLDIEPSDLGFSYEIETASGQLVKIDKVIRGDKNNSGGISLKSDLTIKVLNKTRDTWLIDFIETIETNVRETTIDVIRCAVKLINNPTLMNTSIFDRFLEDTANVGLVYGTNRGNHMGVTGFVDSDYAKDLDKGWYVSACCEGWFIEDFSKITKSLTVLAQKSKTFDWVKEHESVFQTLMDTLCNAPILALPDRPKDFMVYYDASGLGLGCVLMQRGKVIAYASRQLKIHEKNYTAHDLELELFSDYDCEIRYHPGKANVAADALSRKNRVKPKRVKAMNMTLQSSIKDRILVAQKEGSDEDRYWWSGMKKDIAVYEGIVMDFMTKLPRTSSGHDTIWVIMDGLTKHGVPISIIFDRVSQFTSRFWQSMQKALGTRLDMSTSYHPRTDGQSEHTIKTLKDMPRAYVLDFRGRPELVQETTKKISQIKDRLKVARDRQKSYADKRRKPLEFSIGDYVLLKVSP